MQMSHVKPKVSIIIPVYNAEAYLGDALDSVLKQSLHEIEIICVDDGSEDRSPEILREYADKDDRLILLHQENKGAGTARNLGLQAAKGEYLLFLDADDLFKPELAEHSYLRAKEQNADICVFASENYNNETGIYTPNPRCLRKEYCPKELFNWHDFPDSIFRFTRPNPWTKLFRRDFVLQNDLEFQELPNANDVAFVFTALAVAERITILDEVLVSYRINNPNSLQGSTKTDPLAFYEAIRELKSRLLKFGIYGELESAFLRQVAGLIAYNLNRLRNNIPLFEYAYIFCRENVFHDFALTEKAPDFFERPYQARAIQILYKGTMLEFALKIHYPGIQPERQWPFLINVFSRANQNPEIWGLHSPDLSADASEFFAEPYRWYCKTCKPYSLCAEYLFPSVPNGELMPLDENPLLPVIFFFREELEKQKKSAAANAKKTALAEKQVADLLKTSVQKDKQIESLKNTVSDRDRKNRVLQKTNAALRQTVEKDRKEIDKAKEALEAVYNSKSYRIGNAVVDPISRIQKTLRK